MRYTVAYEGIETCDGRLLLPESVELPTEPVPLRQRTQSEQGGQHVALIGTATDFVREGGLITADLSTVIPVGFGPEIDLDHVTYEFTADDQMVVQAGRLRAVTLGDTPAWPGLLVTGTHGMTEDDRVRAVLFNDIARAPTTKHLLFSDRHKIRDYLWQQGWRREVRPDDVTETHREGAPSGETRT